MSALRRCSDQAQLPEGGRTEEPRPLFLTGIMVLAGTYNVIFPSRSWVRDMGQADAQ
jgi:hypothetical protein